MKISQHLLRLHGSQIRRCILCVAVSTSMQMGYANDSSTGVALTLSSSQASESHTAGLVVKADVLMEGDDVGVSLTPRLRGKAPINSELLISSPRFGWLGDAEPYPDRHFPELRVYSGGRSAKMTDSFQAFVGTKEVSEMLRAAGIDPWAIAQTPPFVSVDGVPSDVVRRLSLAGVLKADGSEYLAQWNAQRTVSVTLQDEQALDMRYRMRPGFVQMSLRNLADPFVKARYCLGGAQLRWLSRMHAGVSSFIARKYAVTVGLDQLPPASVSLSVIPSPGVVLTAVCRRHEASSHHGATLNDVNVVPDRRGVLHILTLEPVGR